uniref:Uncharacterized protein n=1 Tax=Solanum lycopersicum TaxID=4081 RepID=A0A3Q7E9D1_SOLLC
MPSFFVDVRQDLVYEYAHLFSGDPDSDVKNSKFFCGRSSRPCLCIRLAITASHHFLGDPDSDVKKDKYFHGCPSIPCLCIRLAITSFPTHLEAHHFLCDLDSDVKMPNFFMDVRQDFVYAYDWPSQPVRSIWKVKRSPKRAYPSFRRFLCAIAHHFLGDPDSDVKNAKFFCGRPSRPCQTSPEASIPLISTILGDLDSDVKNANFFRRRPSRPCLCIRFAIRACTTHLKAHHFLGDPDSDAKNAKFFCGRPSRPFLCIRLAITACATHLEAHHFLGDPDFDVKKENFFCGCPSIPCLCIRLAITSCPTHLEGQTSPKATYPSFRRFSCAIAHHFLGDLDFDVKNAKFFLERPSRPCLCIRLAIMACPIHLEAHHFLGDPDSDVKNAKFFRGSPSRPCLCIRLDITACPTHLEGQTSPEASIPLISTIFVCCSTSFFGRPSRPCLCIRLAITACLTHFEGQTSPEASIPLISTIFVCITHHFLGDLNSDVKNAKFFYGRPSRPCLCIRLAITSCPTHLEGQTSPKATYPSFRRFSCAIAHHFLGDPDSDVKMPNVFVGVDQDLVYASDSNHFLGDPDSDVKKVKFFCGRPSRPFLCIRLALMALPTHFESQTSPEASITLILTIFALPTHFEGQTSPEASIPLISMIFVFRCQKCQIFFVDVRQDLVNASGWPLRPFRPILKVKRSPKRAYPSFRRYSCAIASHFLGVPDSNVKNAEFFVDVRQDLFYTSANHFLGDPDSDAKNAKYFCGRPSRPSNHFLSDPDFDVKNAKKFCGRPLRPFLWIWLGLTALTTHFEGQMSLEASIPLISMIFGCYSKPFFG